MWKKICLKFSPWLFMFSLVLEGGDEQGYWRSLGQIKGLLNFPVIFASNRSTVGEYLKKLQQKLSKSGKKTVASFDCIFLDTFYSRIWDFSSIFQMWSLLKQPWCWVEKQKRENIHGFMNYLYLFQLWALSLFLNISTLTFLPRNTIWLFLPFQKISEAV